MTARFEQVRIVNISAITQSMVSIFATILQFIIINIIYISRIHQQFTNIENIEIAQTQETGEFIRSCRCSAKIHSTYRYNISCITISQNYGIQGNDAFILALMQLNYQIGNGIKYIIYVVLIKYLKT